MEGEKGSMPRASQVFTKSVQKRVKEREMSNQNLKEDFFKQESWILHAVRKEKRKIKESTVFLFQLLRKRGGIETKTQALHIALIRFNEKNLIK